MLHFLKGHSGAIVRVFNYHAYFGEASRLQITTDASPWGVGGYLTIDGHITAYFSDAITEEDARVLQRDIGSHEAQQAFEALALLVAFRLWRKELSSSRTVIAVRTDNVGALTMVAALKGSGHALNLIARELALDLSEYTYFPHVITHLPGISNVIADALSRRFDPSKQPFVVPCALQHLRPTVAPPRPLSWWRVLAAEVTLSAGSS